MPTPHRCRNIARFVLAWFVFALGVAAASPLVRTQDQQLVCTAAGGFQIVGVDDGGAPRTVAGLQDCPVCIMAGAPPQQLRLSPLLPDAVTERAPRIALTRTAWRSAPPLPARGPPAQA